MLDCAAIRLEKMEGLSFSAKLHPLPLTGLVWTRIVQNSQGEQYIWRSVLFLTIQNPSANIRILCKITPYRLGYTSHLCGNRNDLELEQPMDQTGCNNCCKIMGVHCFFLSLVGGSEQVKDCASWTS